MPPYAQKYDGISVVEVQKPDTRRGLPYRYLVMTRGAVSHCAFYTRPALDTWMDERGLSLKQPQTVRGEAHWWLVAGQYSRAMYMDEGAFYRLTPVILRTKVLSNARWTLGLITEDQSGNRIVNLLNPNVRSRPEFTKPGLK